MSGGAFEYCQDRFGWQIAAPLQREISRNKIPEDWELENGCWEGHRWSDETIAEFKKALEALRVAYVYVQRIDWLLSCDDGEDTFHRRLADDLRNFQFTEVEDCNDV